MAVGYGYFGRFDEQTARMYRFLELLLLWSYRLAANVINRYVRPPARILEIGPGTGRLADILSRRGYYVVGIDVSLPMLRRARRFWRPDFINGGSWALPIMSSRFDAAVAMFTLHHWGDYEYSIRNVYDSLRPGSVFIIVEADADRIGPMGGHSCGKTCLTNVLSPYFNIEFLRSFPLIIAIGKRLE